MFTEGKAMIVRCDYAFCIHNQCGKCTHDKITLSIDGVCDYSFDRGKLSMAEKFLRENNRIK